MQRQLRCNTVLLSYHLYGHFPWSLSTKSQAPEMSWSPRNVLLLPASIIARNVHVKAWQLIYKLSSLSEIAKLKLMVGDTLSLLTYCDPGLLRSR